MKKCLMILLTFALLIGSLTTAYATSVLTAECPNCHTQNDASTGVYQKGDLTGKENAKVHYLLYTCSNADCGQQFVVEEAHDFQRDTSRDVAATCTAKGVEAYTCSKCGAHNDKETDMIAHDFQRDTSRDVAATCTKKGVEAYTCSKCSTHNDKETEMLKHDFQRDTSRDVAATCTKKGVEAYTCSVCGTHGDKETAMLKHDYKTKVVASTCTEKGYTLHSCKVCKDSYKDKYTAKLMHWYGEWTPDEKGETHTATCKRDGCKHKDSTACTMTTYTIGGIEMSFCAVCGRLDNTTLEMVKDAMAEFGKNLEPKGELIARMGTLEDGTKVLSLSFEYAGKLQPLYGDVKITLPAEMLENVNLSLIGTDGSETPVIATIDEKTASFTLNCPAKDEKDVEAVTNLLIKLG